MNLEDIILSESGQKENMIHDSTHMRNLPQADMLRQTEWSGNCGIDLLVQSSVGEMRKILQMNGGNGCTALCIGLTLLRVLQ